jgi:hypothetical protein
MASSYFCVEAASGLEWHHFLWSQYNVSNGSGAIALCLEADTAAWPALEIDLRGKLGLDGQPGAQEGRRNAKTSGSLELRFQGQARPL